MQPTTSPPMPPATAADETIEIKGETLRLLPEHAAYWPAERTLFIGDLHWGKAATFRQAGIAVPDTEVDADLGRISRMLDRTGATRLVVLGDLLHSRRGRDAQTFAAVTAWRETHPGIELTLVEGNHDRGAGRPPREWGFEVVAPGAQHGPFVLQHYPDPHDDGYVLAGHLHPKVKLRGAGGQEAKLPCFWFGQRVAVLPAFGSLIDGAPVKPRPRDAVFVIADDEVIDVSVRNEVTGVPA